MKGKEVIRKIAITVKPSVSSTTGNVIILEDSGKIHKLVMDVSGLVFHTNSGKFYDDMNSFLLEKIGKRIKAVFLGNGNFPIARVLLKQLGRSNPA